MSNHFHILLEVPPMPKGGLSDEELLKRLSAIYNEAFVAGVAEELIEARKSVTEGRAKEEILVQRIHERFTYRMHDLGQFMKGLLQCYTQWHNKKHNRTGRLWGDRFKSVIVEDGFAARTIAAYIDLNPVRAGIVTEPADYRWSSYGEAIGGGPKGNGKTARAGLVRAWGAHKGMEADAKFWGEIVANEYRKYLISKTGEKSEPAEIPWGTKLLHRVRYFTDGAVIGSKSFVDNAFLQSRNHFGPKRTSGARRMKNDPSPRGEATLWSLRNLRKGLSE